MEKVYYHASMEYLGETKVFTPRVPPKKMLDEDNITPRICVCESPNGCIEAIQIASYARTANNWYAPIYIYVAIVDDKFIIHPTENMVPDVKRSGEIWITTPIEFKLFGIYKVDKGSNDQSYSVGKYSISIDDAIKSTKELVYFIHHDEPYEDVKDWALKSFEPNMRDRLFYHISLKDLGESVLMTPRVPDTHMNGEDKLIPRICVCPTIYGCVKAIYIPQLCENGGGLRLNNGEYLPLYLYATYAKNDNIMVPTPSLVPDVENTGEVWLTKEHVFTFVKKLKIHKQFDIPFSAYSRYAVSPYDDDEIIDKISAQMLYGYDSDNFSYIDWNPHRADLAIKFHEFLLAMEMDLSEYEKEIMDDFEARF